MSDWRDYQDQNVMGQLFSNPKVWIGLLAICVLGFCILGTLLG